MTVNNWIQAQAGGSASAWIRFVMQYVGETCCVGQHRWMWRKHITHILWYKNVWILLSPHSLLKYLCYVMCEHECDTLNAFQESLSHNIIHKWSHLAPSLFSPCHWVRLLWHFYLPPLTTNNTLYKLVLCPVLQQLEILTKQLHLWKWCV